MDKQYIYRQKEWKKFQIWAASAIIFWIGGSIYCSIKDKGSFPICVVMILLTTAVTIFTGHMKQKYDARDLMNKLTGR